MAGRGGPTRRPGDEHSDDDVQARPPGPDGGADPGPVFAALSDPTRRAVLRAVADRGDATATELVAEIAVSRQAVAKHLELLAEAGLVCGERTGRERRWRVTPAPLLDAAGWMGDVGAAWDRRLARLASRVHRSSGDRAGGDGAASS